MVATIKLSPYVYVQGLVSRTLPNGSVVIAFNGREYVGSPLAAAAA